MKNHFTVSARIIGEELFEEKLPNERANDKGRQNRNE